MTPKPPAAIDPRRLRHKPSPSFSWIDQRLLRDQHLQHCPSSHTLALYFILVLVGNQHGMSYYSDCRLQQLSKLSPERFHEARRQLQRQQLIAYQKPYYQVLDLSIPSPLPITESTPTKQDQRTQAQRPTEQESAEIVRQCRVLRQSLLDIDIPESKTPS